MDNRFGFKDFVFVVCLLLVVGAVVFMSMQFNRQESRLSSLQDDVQRLAETGKQQAGLLDTIRKSIQSGVTVNSTQSAESRPTGIIRRKTENGGLYVYYPQPPRSPRDPRNFADYASGDWLIRNLGSEPSVVTPYIDKDAYGNEVQGPVLETLITRNPETLEYEPFLAESYEIIPDKLIYRFKLRENIWFSDRTPITADDVIFSFNTVMTPGVEADRTQSYLKQIEYVKKIDDRTIDVKFKKPYFLGLEVAGAGWEIIPRKVYEFKDAKEYNSRTELLVGSGPYLFDPKKWQKGQQIELVRNPNYWGERPTFDRIVFRLITNQQAALQAFQNEEIDETTPLPDQFEKFSTDPEFLKKFTVRKFKRPNAGYRYIGWNLKKPMFSDKLTRQALTELLDRDAINKTIQRGLSYPITGPFSPMVPQADQAIKPWAYDPEDAKKKLAEAGWKLGKNEILQRDGKDFSFSLLIPSQSTNYEQLAAYVKEQYKKVGIDVRILPTEFSVLVDKLDNRDYDAAILGWTGSIEGDPYQIWHSDSFAGKGSNYIGFTNPVADALIVEGRAELNEEKRVEIWHKLHRIIHDEQPYTFLHATMSLAFINGRFQNTEPYTTGLDRGDWYTPSAKQKYR